MGHLLQVAFSFVYYSPIALLFFIYNFVVLMIHLTMGKLVYFIIVDDDEIHNHLCTVSIKKYHPGAEVISFTDAAEALVYIRQQYNPGSPRPTILLLDLNMPVVTGWDFLDLFVDLDELIRKQLDVYILSSSIDARDKEKAWRNNTICGYMEKPLNEYQLDSMAFVRALKDNTYISDTNILIEPNNTHIGLDERMLLDKILPHFQLNEVVQVHKCVRKLESEMPGLRNMPTNLYADNIKSFLIANKFAHNLSGDPLINKKGMDLAMAGSLHEYEKLEHQLGSSAEVTP